MKKYFLIILSFLSLLVSANTYTLFSHYSEKEGLSEINVTSMLQDRKGQMWFGTYDGLNLFNGYTFKNYKSNPGGEGGLKDFRIDQIRQDKLGYLWVLAYDGCVYRFNPKTERFIQIPQNINEFKNFNSKFQSIYTFQDGSVWLSGKSCGCFSIKNNNIYDEFNISYFSETNGLLCSDQINKIYSDQNKNVWILTENGLSFIKNGKSVPLQLFRESNHGGFYSIYEYNDKIWLGGDHGKVRIYDTVKESFDVIAVPCSSAIVDIVQFNTNEVVFLSRKDGFYLYNIKSQTFKIYNQSSGSGLKSNKFYSCYLDKHKNIWLESDLTGVVYFDTKFHKVYHLEVESAQSKQIIPLRFFVIEDKFGNIWVHPRYGGLSLFNNSLKKLEYQFGKDNSSGEKFSNVMHSAYSDRQGNLWLSPYSHGIEKIVFIHSPFNFHKTEPDETATSSNEVRAIYEDSQKRIWVSSKNGIVYIFNLNHQKIGYLNEDGSIGNGSPLKVIAYSIFEDEKSNIWLGTKGNGLFKLEKDQLNGFSITNYRYNADDVYSLSNDNIYCVFQDHLKRIWLATYGGGINLIDESAGGIRFLSFRNKFRNFPVETCSRVRFITEDNRGIFYAGTTGGMLVFKNEKTINEKLNFVHVAYNPSEKGCISGNDVHNILPAQNGKLYLAIFGGGLNILDKPFELDKPNIFRSYMIKNGAPSNVFFTVREDNMNNIWFSTQTTIGKFNTKDEIFETYKPQSKNNYIFMEAAVCKTSSGEMAFGTSDGYLTFNFIKPLKSNYNPEIILTDLQIFNKSMEVDVAESPLHEIIDETNILELNHKQNVFTISFAALDYSDLSNIQYAYKLDGFDKEWNYVHNQRNATYTNIPKGKYIFRVKSTNSDGIWVNNERSIVIIKKPSFWQSEWGYALYVILFILIAGLAIYIMYKFFILKTNVDIEHKMTDLKLKFFTDISHELRTPLTLIASPVENVLKTERLSETASKQLHLVQRNVDRMLKLITQILDFRKIQNNKMKLLIEPVNSTELINEISQSFSSIAEEKNILIEIADEANNCIIWVDKDKFEKIFFNLISNAIKFSRSKSKIVIKITENQHTLLISVQDEGIGIAREKVKLLFNRFESFVNANVSFQQGTGIGLSLTRELTEMHHAKIGVESELGMGSVFTITFLKGKSHFAENEEFKTIKEENEIHEITVNNDLDHPEENTELAFHEKQQILIVEDNYELRDFLKIILSNKYEVIESENGKRALEILQNELPDLIISDIMMPEIDGLEFAKIVKEDIKTSHIPVVLLTARTDLEVKLEALQNGADDYITKPFSSAYLEARVENLLKIRQHLQELYRTTLISGVKCNSGINPGSKDDIFIQKIISFIEENIDNAELTIEEIAAHMVLGRSTFFKKLKSMIGISPVEFLKDYRIQKAANLIESGEHNFSEISYRVGINDSSYFSRCFKQKFGVTPREYKDNCQKR